MAMHHGNFRLPPQCHWQVEGHQIPAHGGELFFLLRRNSPNRHAGAKTFDGAAGFCKRVRREAVFGTGTEDQWRYAVLAQPVKQSQQGGFRAAPFGGIILSEQMDHLHGWQIWHWAMGIHWVIGHSLRHCSLGVPPALTTSATSHSIGSCACGAKASRRWDWRLS